MNTRPCVEFSLISRRIGHQATLLLLNEQHMDNRLFEEHMLQIILSIKKEMLMKWVPVDRVFDVHAGTRQARYLLERRVRNRHRLQLRRYIAVNDEVKTQPIEEDVEIQPYTVGFLGRKTGKMGKPDNLSELEFAFRQDGREVLSRTELSHSSAYEVILNWPMLRWYFDIEVKG